MPEPKLTERIVKHIDEVDLANIKGIFSKEKHYRYLLEIPFVQSETRDKILTVILKNPSKATEETADTTVNRIENYVSKNLSDIKILNILNLFAFRATETKDLQEELSKYPFRMSMSHLKNDKIINETLDKSDIIISAWGDKSRVQKKIYDARVLDVLNIINKEQFRDKVYEIIRNVPNINYPKPNQYPLHGQVWGYKWELSKYFPDID